MSHEYLRYARLFIDLKNRTSLLLPASRNSRKLMRSRYQSPANSERPDDNGTWDLVSLPTSKKAIGCCLVFAIKFNPDGYVARLKTRLVAKGYAQIYGVDYSDTFSPIAKLTSIRLFISLSLL